MPDPAGEYDSMIILVRDSWRGLQRVDPKHDLLKYLKSVNDMGFDFDTKYWNEFVDRFSNPPKPTWVVYVDYHKAMDKAKEEASSKGQSAQPARP